MTDATAGMCLPLLIQYLNALDDSKRACFVVTRWKSEQGLHSHVGISGGLSSQARRQRCRAGFVPPATERCRGRNGAWDENASGRWDKSQPTGFGGRLSGMPNYRRPSVAGATYFLTLVTHNRVPLFDSPAARHGLRRALGEVRGRRTFEMIAAVLLPEHLHLIVTLPSGDADVSTRVAALKAGFTRKWLRADGGESTQSVGRRRQGYRGVWQKRFWDHLVRDETALAECCDYVHFNPVKHGHARCPHAWPFSTFHRHVRENHYPSEWMCACQPDRLAASPPRDVPGAEAD